MCDKNTIFMKWDGKKESFIIFMFFAKSAKNGMVRSRKIIKIKSKH